MRTLEEIDAKLEKQSVEAEKAKRQRSWFVIVALTGAALIFAFYAFVFYPTAATYTDHEREEIADKAEEDNKAGAYMPVASLTTGVLLFFILVLFLPYKKKFLDRIQLYNALKGVRKALESPGGEEKTRRIYVEQIRKEGFSGILKRHYLLILLIALAALLSLLAFLVYIAVRITLLTGFEPFMMIALFVKAVVVIIAFISLSSLAKLRTKQEAKAEVLTWVFSEPEESSPE